MHIVVLVRNALGWGDPIIQQCKTLAGLLDEDDSGADSPVWQFCTTSPGGILLGLRSKSLGWIPTVTIPNPDQPPS